MNFYCIKSSKFTENGNMKIKLEIGEKISLYTRCINCGFKKFETIEEKELKFKLYIK